ncbi:hypothetical protein ACN28G_03005 [Micromonospora sp. WMMA1923]|uniref:hypothetical protein n=1 Tax=Micromonospora sp. WMMA1923 TaxID=3404125 RepID=UPI003B92AE44
MKLPVIGIGSTGLRLVDTPLGNGVVAPEHRGLMAQPSAPLPRRTPGASRLELFGVRQNRTSDRWRSA